MEAIKPFAQVLPQYRPRPDGDRLKKKEKYDEALRFIQELMDCDEFEDISTLRVSSQPLFVILFHIFSCSPFLCLKKIQSRDDLLSGRWRPSRPQLFRLVRQTLPHRRPHRPQTGRVDPAASLLRGNPCRAAHPPPHQQVARAARPHHLRLPGHLWHPEVGDYSCRRIHSKASSGGVNEPGDPPDLPHLHDGSTDHDGPAAAGRWHDGGEDHQGDHQLPQLPAEQAGVCLPQGRCHAHARR